MIKNVTKYIHCFKMLQFKSINIKKVKVTLCKRRTTYHTDSAVEPKLFFTFPFPVRLLKSYGSGSVSRPKKHFFFKKKIWKKLPFYILGFFYKEKIDKFHQIYCKM
jgi:hypothetical protein